VQLRAQGLLDMQYKPVELAAELGLPVSAVYRRLIPAGLPHHRDRSRRIWIRGAEVMPWLRRHKPSQLTLKPDEGYCVKCRRGVPLVAPRREAFQSSARLVARCPICGQPIYRGVKQDDQPS
jgi:hypothetical protein